MSDALALIVCILLTASAPIPVIAINRKAITMVILALIEVFESMAGRPVIAQ
jgi:hypothetical protein